MILAKITGARYPSQSIKLGNTGCPHRYEYKKRSSMGIRRAFCQNVICQIRAFSVSLHLAIVQSITSIKHFHFKARGITKTVVVNVYNYGKNPLPIARNTQYTQLSINLWYSLTQRCKIKLLHSPCVVPVNCTRSYCS